MQPTGNTMLITGGTSGIGRKLAERFHGVGNHVIIAGRRERLLREVVEANPGMIGYLLDVTDPLAVRRCAEEVAEDYPALNTLINNAGIMAEEDVCSATDNPAIAENTIATNLLGPIRLTAALLPHLLNQPRAAVITVSSGLAFVPMARTATYCATKAAIHSYTVSLRHQLRETSVEVIELIPPYVQTELMGPGQATDPHAMPLDEFIDETMSLVRQQPTPPEVRVDRVHWQRLAEAEGRYDAVFAALNPDAPAFPPAPSRT